MTAHLSKHAAEFANLTPPSAHGTAQAALRAALMASTARRAAVKSGRLSGFLAMIVTGEDGRFPL
ncbi:MAG: hypothetical protein KC425_18915 [Anaerolineales bacterium]|nr:hypothetical protein [Anaerolineales bacterium]